MRTYYAAICEDQVTSLNFIKENLTMLFEMQHIDIRLDTYTNGNELIDVMNRKARYDILFLDIEMPHISGMDVARMLRKSNPDIYIVFITNREDQVYESFEVKPFRFLRKSHFSQEVPAMVKALSTELKKLDSLSIPVKELHSGIIYNLNVNKIIYIEVQGRYCHVITTKDDFEFQYKLKDLIEQLSGQGFLQPHRSFLVNYRFISSLQKDTVLLTTKEEIPLSRGYKNTFQNDFFSLMRNH